MKEFFKVILYQPLYNALMFLVFLIPGNDVGLAIIILTILIRLALLPSANKALKASRDMKALQPKMEEIKTKYSKEEQAQKLMELYKEHGVNPVGSCLPLLIQLPIIYVLYRVFRDGLNGNNFELLYSFIPRPETIDTIFLGIDLTKPEKWILPILAAGLQFVQAWQMQKFNPISVKPATEGQPDMTAMMNKQMLYLFPAMTFMVAFRVPAALALYWVATTLFTVVQQWYFFKGQPTGKLVKIEPAKNKKSKFKTKSKDVVVTVRRKGE